MQENIENFLKFFTRHVTVLHKTVYPDDYVQEEINKIIIVTKHLRTANKRLHHLEGSGL